MPFMAKKNEPGKPDKPQSNVVTFAKKGERKYIDIDMITPRFSPTAADPNKGYASIVAMLQETINDIEAGRVNPKDCFLGMYSEDPTDKDLYIVHVRRTNLTPLELIGRLSHILRDMDP